LNISNQTILNLALIAHANLRLVGLCPKASTGDELISITFYPTKSIPKIDPNFFPEYSANYDALLLALSNACFRHYFNESAVLPLLKLIGPSFIP
jgi:hypothetical protein